MPAEGLATTLPPSSVYVDTFPFLVNTLGKAEAEMTAALVVKALQLNGDSWRPVGWPEVVDAIKAEIAAGRGPWERLLRNPFFKPNIHSLLRVRRTSDGSEIRYAQWADAEGKLLEFTPAGIEALTSRGNGSHAVQ